MQALDKNRAVLDDHEAFRLEHLEDREPSNKKGEVGGSTGLKS